MSVGAANLRWLSVAGTTGAQDRPKQVGGLRRTAAVR